MNRGDDGERGARDGCPQDRTARGGNGPDVQLDLAVPGGAPFPRGSRGEVPPDPRGNRERGAVRPPSARRRQGQDPLPERVPRRRQQPRPQLHLRTLPAAGRHPRLLHGGDPAGTPRVLPLPPATPRGKRGGEARRDPERRGGAGDRAPSVQLQGGSLAEDHPTGRGGNFFQPGGRALADDPHGKRILRGRRRGSARRIFRSLPR